MGKKVIIEERKKQKKLKEKDNKELEKIIKLIKKRLEHCGVFIAEKNKPKPNEEILEILKTLDQFLILLRRLRNMARRQYSPRYCPLARYDHYKVSQILWGIGCWKWKCEFCGEEFQE